MQAEFMSTISMARDEANAAARAETRVEMPLEVLAGKFGEVPEDVASEVRAATEDQLRAWARVAGNAGTLDQVFSPSGVSRGPRRAAPQAAEARAVPGKGRAGFLARLVRKWRRNS
jgi:hypothetical protein